MRTARVLLCAFVLGAGVGLIVCACGGDATMSKGPEPFEIAAGEHMFIWPDVSGDTIVWTDDRETRDDLTGNLDIYGLDLATGKEFAVCTEPGRQIFPRVSGDIVVWTDQRASSSAGADASAHDNDVYAYDLSRDREFPVAVGPGSQTSPDVSGDVVVWVGPASRPGSGSDIYARDLVREKTFTVCDAKGNQMNPSISGDLVVWADWRAFEGVDASGDLADIYACDLSTHEERRLSPPGGGGSWPVVDGDTVVWAGRSTGDADSFGVCDVVSGETWTVATGMTSVPRYALCGGRVAWAEFSESEALSEYLKVSDVKGAHFMAWKRDQAAFPTLGDDLVVWQDFQWAGAEEGPLLNRLMGARLEGQ